MNQLEHERICTLNPPPPLCFGWEEVLRLHLIVDEQVPDLLGAMVAAISCGSLVIGKLTTLRPLKRWTISDC